MAPRVFSHHEREAISWRRDQQKKTLIDILNRMFQYSKLSNDRQGFAEVLNLLIKAAMLEYEETGRVENAASMLFEIYMKIKYLRMEHKEMRTYIDLVSKLVDKIARENENLGMRQKGFKREFTHYTTLLEEMHHALYYFNHNKANKNVFLKALYGCRFIELLIKARLYHEIKMF